MAATNIEQIVAWLIDEKMLCGLHFTDRKYADDDLTVGSIDTYQAFCIFNEIFAWEHEKGKDLNIAYVIDQSHTEREKVVSRKEKNGCRLVKRTFVPSAETAPAVYYLLSTPLST